MAESDWNDPERMRSLGFEPDEDRTGREKWEPTEKYAEPTPPPLPERLTRGNLTAGLHRLMDDARAGHPDSAAVLAELERLRADLARIPIGARSKHGTHRWTGRHWKEL